MLELDPSPPRGPDVATCALLPSTSQASRVHTQHTDRRLPACQSTFAHSEAHTHTYALARAVAGSYQAHTSPPFQMDPEAPPTCGGENSQSKRKTRFLHPVVVTPSG